LERKKAYLNFVDYLLAPNQLTNETLSRRFPNLSAEKIFKTTGINYRYSIGIDAVVSDFAASCANNFFQHHPIKKEEIDFLIFCTECPDYLGPATSCIVQYKLGLSTQIGTFDLAFGCSGYTYGLSMAKALVESGIANNVLFVTADIPTTVLSKDDEQLHFLFSDASSISLISSKEVGYKIGDFSFGTDGSGATKLMSRNSAFVEPKDAEWFAENKNETLSFGRMEMDGEDVFRFSLREVPRLVQQVLDKNKCIFDNIDLFIFHQASNIILKSLQRKLRIPDERFFCNLAEVGNTVSASIPIALEQARERNIIKPGMKIMVLGFGIGYSWSGTIIQS
jgi:3-oxoacyl-[acyl-carrier-protein] synthase-3